MSSVVVIVSEINSTSRFQTLGEAVCVSFRINPFGKIINLFFFIPSAGFFRLGNTTNLQEGKTEFET